MSKGIKDFMEVLFKDKLLFEKFIKMNTKFESQEPGVHEAKEIFEQEIMPMLSDAGFEFSYEDLLVYADRQNQSTIDNMSDDELETVTGGSGSKMPTYTPISIFGV